MQRRSRDSFQSFDLPSLAWAFATMGVPTAMGTIAQEAKRLITEFSGQNLSNTVWAFARCSLDDAPLMQSIAKEVTPKLNSMSAQHLSNTAWACEHMGRADKPLPNSLAAGST